jgi:hypothetical protein
MNPAAPWCFVKPGLCSLRRATVEEGRMSENREIGCLETFKPTSHEYLAGGKAIHYFEYTFKDGVDPDLAQQTAFGLSIAHFLDCAA